MVSTIRLYHTISNSFLRKIKVQKFIGSQDSKRN